MNLYFLNDSLKTEIDVHLLLMSCIWIVSKMPLFIALYIVNCGIMSLIQGKVWCF